MSAPSRISYSLSLSFSMLSVFVAPHDSQVYVISPSSVYVGALVCTPPSHLWPVASFVCTFSLVCALKAVPFSFLKLTVYFVSSGSVQFLFCVTSAFDLAVSVSVLSQYVHFLTAVHSVLSALHVYVVSEYVWSAIVNLPSTVVIS